MPRGVSHLADQTHYVYEAWMGATPLYVGLTCDLGRRLGEHAHKSWWPHVTRLEVSVHPTRVAAVAVERGRIAELKPTHNICGTRGERDGELTEAEHAQLVAVLDRIFALSP